MFILRIFDDHCSRSLKRLILLALPRGEREVNNNNKLTRILGKSHCIEDQSVSPALPKPKFEPLSHSVYFGREPLDQYVRVSPTRCAAYDAHDRHLGRFSWKQASFTAVGLNSCEPGGTR
jgi:hypothetical protein